MKRFHLTLAVAIAALAIVLIQTRGTASTQSDDEKTLIRIEHELLDAMLKNDFSVVERHYADSFTFTTPDGQLMNKAGIVSNLKTGVLKFESSKIDDIKVQLYGDTAVVISRTTDRGRVKDVDVSGQYRWIDVFVRREGRWQLVAAQGTRIVQ